MSGYPGTGNIQVLLRKLDSTYHTWKVEEIILSMDDPSPVVAALRELKGTSHLSLSIYETLEGGEIDRGLEAEIWYTFETDVSAPTEASFLAQEVLAVFKSFLAPSAEWIFSPLSEVDLLRLKPEDVSGLRVEFQQSPSNDAADGRALLVTDRGQISVFQQKGYLRLAWLDYHRD